MSSLIFGNSTNIVDWEASPVRRGTFDILSTCIITLLLCVWTAVHLNVPPPESWWRPKLRKVGWLILALLAPEMVAYTAWYQRREALAIMREVNKAYGLENPPSWRESAVEKLRKIVKGLRLRLQAPKQGTIRQPTLEAQEQSTSDERTPWTIVHGFYAVMGGFAIQIPGNLPKSKKFLPSSATETWFLTDHSIRKMLSRPALLKEIPNVSEAEIKSKSKANGLAKTLVCVQASWFVAQCLTRCQRIPISLLELSTFGHAICTLLTYLLWWEKPFEVDCPTIIQDEGLWGIRAINWMENNSSSVVRRFQTEFQTWLDENVKIDTLSEDESHQLIRSSWEESALISTPQERAGFPDFTIFTRRVLHSREKKPIHDNRDEHIQATLAPGQNLGETELSIRHPQDIVFSLLGRHPLMLESLVQCESDQPRLPAVKLDTEAVNRWKLAWHTIQEFQSHWDYTAIFDLADRCRDWPDLWIIGREPFLWLGFCAAGIIYGGLHALAWFAHFRSPTEQSLWRISATVIMVELPALMCQGFFTGYFFDWGTFEMMREVTERLLNSEAKSFIRVFSISFDTYISLFWLSVLVYILARAYLVVECFINLSSLPDGVYDVPQWAAYFPHIS